MQLDEFVKTSIVQIAKGVKDAQDEVEALGGAVNPTQYTMGGRTKPDKEKIEFDVALVVQDSTSSEVGGKLSVVSMFGMSGKHSGSDSYQQTSRVKFNVHVDLPYAGKIG
ncbi:hypothetical protein ACK31P_06505 [Aeromonas caviae]